MDGGKQHEKPEHPRASANVFSALTFWWILSIFWKGYKRDLETTDISAPLQEHKSDYLGDKFEKFWNEEVKLAAQRKRKASLLRVIARCFGPKIMVYGFFLFTMEVLLRLSQPLLLGRLVRHFSAAESDASITIEEAYIYAAGVVLCSALNVIVIHPYMMAIFHMGMKIRVACCSLIYRKALRLSMTALGETTAGQVVNLMSNDVNRFDVAVVFLHYLWIGPIETFVVTYFMWNEVGPSAAIGVASLLLFIPLQGFLGKKTSEYRLKTAIRTDERVRLMNEIISGIQVIKMYTWEIPFAKLVNSTRKNEVRAIRATSYIRGIALSFIIFTTRISIFITILSYVLFGYQIRADKVFVLVSYYQILRQTMTVFFPQGIAQIAEAQVSINRLQKFMLYEERDSEVVEHEPAANNGLQHDGVNDVGKEERITLGIRITNATAQWTPVSHEKTLNKVTVDIKPGMLVAVIGPVGAGKTSLLQAILRELPLIEGTIEVGGTLSYASQEPWMFAGSLRQNILFGQPFVRERYTHVVHVCALKRDFMLLPYADKTIVGERGVSLSGGQRARANLARAIYKDADVYLLDDPLSAVDPHVGKHLFEDCIAGFLKGKTVILATHQLHHLKQADLILVLDNGSVAAQGTYSELKATGLDFVKLLNDDLEEETLEEQKIFRQTSISSVNSVEVTEPKEVAEMRTVGSVTSKVYGTYLRSGGNWCIILTTVLLFILTQALASGCDYWITYWTNIEEMQFGLRDWDNVNGSLANGYSVNESLTNDTSVENTLPDTLSREMCIYIYTAVTVGTILVTLMRSITFFSVCMRASIHLHDSMFRSITRATMYFFNTNPSGRILNRFSKDMGAIDELLPSAMIDCLQIGLAILGIIVVVAIVNVWLLIPTFFVGVTFYLLRIVYLSTSRSVKRLEGLTRSPVFQHLNASLQGLTTIRAFKAQAVLEKEFDNHQDLHSGAWYLFIASSRAFGFWLDMVCLIYITLVTISFFVIGGENTGGNVGLAITQAIGLTGMLQWGMRQSTELENQMTSVERVMEFTHVEQEPPLTSPQDKKPPKSWPSEGVIKFDRLYLRYSPAEEPVLKNLNFTIQAKQKVGIVGRTGAGKSSLIAALFRLAPLEGSIYIDGIDTLTVGLHELRNKLSIIPQEPVLFSGTLRKNLDPFDEYSDSILWRALEEVELKDVVNDLSAGLNSKVMEGGSNFSVGQRQLVCLARAIIRNNTILVLDEATANVDPQTDTLIQQTIRKKFVNCTVLTIAHRLNTVMDSDRVLVMDAGTMVEFDHPHVLLLNKNGFLFNMVQQTGKGMIETLTKKAKMSYDDTESKQS
ncbi:putative multidrug resistance-associated protein lethal(2)03659 [Cryptotermes secundus]|uniref:Putative multidrug resistance-associated protein lethal(2)03659 n=1 Tax=Cryptotermes secundus TaxID=105785 RepID=A0A2J7PEN6_9NEOP|nr:probable multidrug resistance-associated protein lethal(2)03659 [Cryptotermes secundus]XP_033611345.1 probable multidrug resistance-associated protein lethal(2)03659 [Cryptotermes secundus]PNF14801.1 putative multidrug resistance-associated protein lethal(2)03659 [Cryptotermes secundus]